MFFNRMKLKQRLRVIEQGYLESLNNERKLEREIVKLNNELKKAVEEIKFISTNLKDYYIIGEDFNKNGTKFYVCLHKYGKNIDLYLKSNCSRTGTTPRCYAELIEKENGSIECKIIDLLAGNIGVGNGTILLKHLVKYLKGKKVKEISGWLSPVDKDDFDKLEHFYKKNGFTVGFNSNKTSGSIKLRL